MSFDPAYEDFLSQHSDEKPVFEFAGCHYRLKTREGLFVKEELAGLNLPFISCLAAYRKRLQEDGGYSEDEVAAIDGMAIGKYSGDILFISHETGAVCVHYVDGTADAEEVAPSIGEFLAGLKPRR